VKTTPCESCGAEVIWAEIDGKRIPLNKRRVRAYLGPVDEGFVPGGGLRCFEKRALVHISHFVTCPNASSHSKGRQQP
jgi:hypothetical protein